MLSLRAVRHRGPPIHDAESSCRVCHSPVAVGVGDELRSPLRLVLDALIRVLRHVSQDAVCVVVHGLRRKRQCSSEDADR
eukprot:4744265-Pleurochrysis_carterae.AAC.1